MEIMHEIVLENDYSNNINNNKKYKMI